MNQSEYEANTLTAIWMDRQGDRQTGADSQSDRQADREIDYSQEIGRERQTMDSQRDDVVSPWVVEAG